MDDLSQVIRQVDGNHTLGAGSLAEAILEKLPHLASRQPVGEPVDDYDSAFQEADRPPYLVDAAGYYALQSFLTVAEEFRRSAEPYIEAINEGACGGEDEVSQAFDTQLARAKEAVSRSVVYAAPPAQAVAARQPVGEPPMEMRICELRHVSLKPNRPYIFTVDANCANCSADAAYAMGQTDTRPAQAVDLGQIWQQAFNDTAHSYRRNKSRMWVLQMLKERVQALIDSQAVGNG